MNSEDDHDSPEEIALYQAVAGAMKVGRVNMGLSHADFAELAGMKKSYIIGLERGTANPTLRTILRIATAIGVDPVELLPGSTRPGLQPAEIEPLLKSCRVLCQLIEERKREQQESADRELAALEEIVRAIEKLAPLHLTTPDKATMHPAEGPTEAGHLKAPGGGHKKSSKTH